MKPIGNQPGQNPQQPEPEAPEPEAVSASDGTGVPEFGSEHSTPDPGDFPDDLAGDDLHAEDVTGDGVAALPSGVVDADKFYERFLFAGHMMGMGVTAKLELPRVPESFAWESDPYGRRVSDGIHAFILARPSLHWALSSDLEKMGLVGVIALFGFNRFMALRAELPGLIAERDALRGPAQGDPAASPGHGAGDTLRAQEGDTL